MKNKDLLERFNKEVLLSGREAALPKNLSDEWLEVLLAQSSSMTESNEAGRVTELIAAVIQIHFVKKGSKSVSFSESELIDSIGKYSAELVVEELRRKTNFNGNPATLENILTDRLIEFRVLQ